MYLEKLKLTNYRNYQLVDEKFSPKFNILFGRNAQGKTNLLEAIYYLSTGRSYRPVRDCQLIRWDKDFFVIDSFFCNERGTNRLEIKYSNSDGIRPSEKEIHINGVLKKKTAEWLGRFNSVLFAPEDLYIVKGSPAERRRLIDDDISQISPLYYQKIQRYTRILNQRNHLLRRICAHKANYDELQVWNHQFCETGAQIIAKRLQVLEKLTPLTRLMHRKLTGGEENLEIRYMYGRRTELRTQQGNVPELEEMLLAEAMKQQKEEIIRGGTLFGPHRDDYAILLNGADLKAYGSQGQHRTAVLAVKLAELEFFKAETGEYPVLLLDDVLSELDEKRRERLVGTLMDKDIQCFITTTEELAPDQRMNNAARFFIRQGKMFLE